MANRHFAKAADVWKHLVLCELLALEQPARYAETHAGCAAYPMTDDAERRFGVLRFLDVARSMPILAATPYAGHTADHVLGGARLYPASPLLAMLERGAAAGYLLCDVDPASTSDLKRWSDRLGLEDHVEVVEGDGLRAVGDAVLGSRHAGSTLVHIDPFDAHAKQPGGRSSVELARDVIRAGVALLYWYGYDAPQQRAWVVDDLAGAGPVWCGDILVTDAAVGTRAAGNLGAATTPGTGFGVVVANVSRDAIERCTALGEVLAAAYRGSTLPDGARGGLDFTATGGVSTPGG